MKKNYYFLIFAVFAISLNVQSQTWSVLSSGTSQSLYGISPLTSNNAISVGDNQTLVKTSNQGTMWTSQILGSSFFARCLEFTSSTVGFAGGSDGGSVQYIYKTIDGGLSWSIVKTGTPAAIYGISFLDASTGYAVCSSPGTSFIYKTTDGGSSWGSLGNSGISNWMKQIKAIDANNVICVGTGGKIQRSSDGGTNWTTSNNGTYDLTGISFPTSSIGYICGFGGKIMKSIDGGNSWNTLSIASSMNFYSIDFIDVNRGFVVGQNGAIFYTSDAGATWTSQTSGTSNILIAVNFYDQNLGYACGTNGTILKYHNNVSVEEVENDLQFSVYPNPTNGTLNVNYLSEANENYSIMIYDQIGKVVFLEKEIEFNGTNTIQIDLSNFSNGMYFVKLQNKNTSSVKRINLNK